MNVKIPRPKIPKLTPVPISTSRRSSSELLSADFVTPLVASGLEVCVDDCCVAEGKTESYEVLEAIKAKRVHQGVS